ncbi:hypothetical protein ON010_g2177 [Phytophthora cinnamomi]|nr:hypothetical protein ON010_g2177 [Phytophthora cinnamomi]
MLASTREARAIGDHLGLVEDGGLDDAGRDHVRVHVGRRATVLEVALALGLRHARDADGRAAVGHAVRERVHAGRLVAAREAALVARAVRGDVLLVLELHLLDGLDDLGHAALLTHGLGRVVGVAAGAVPVARDRLGVPRHVHAEVLAHAQQDVARHPQVVARLDARARAHLVLPLAGHHLGVDAGDVDARVQRRAVVRVHDEAAEHRVRAGAAVVRALRAGEAALGPAVRRHAVLLEQRVLLLDAEPRLLALGRLHHAGRVGARVVGDGRQVRLQAVAQHQDVLAAAERVLEDGHGTQQHLRVLAGRLARARAVEVPHRQVGQRLHGLGQRLGLAAQVLARAADPHVLGERHALGHLKGHVLVVDGAVELAHGGGEGRRLGAWAAGRQIAQ